MRFKPSDGGNGKYTEDARQMEEIGGSSK